MFCLLCLATLTLMQHFKKKKRTKIMKAQTQSQSSSWVMKLIRGQIRLTRLVMLYWNRISTPDDQGWHDTISCIKAAYFIFQSNARNLSGVLRMHWRIRKGRAFGDPEVIKYLMHLTSTATFQEII